MTRCPYCLKEFSNVNPAHLVKHHKKLFDVYQEFPGWDIGKTSKGATLGIKKSKEHRFNISKANKGRIFTKIHRDNISKATMGRLSSRKGKHLSEVTKLKLSIIQRGKHNSPQTEWHKNPFSFKIKNKQTYYALHRWVRKNKGIPQGCVLVRRNQGSCSNYYDWANIDGKYRRNLDDYVPMCRKHHFMHDRQFKVI